MPQVVTPRVNNGTVFQVRIVCYVTSQISYNVYAWRVIYMDPLYTEVPLYDIVSQMLPTLQTLYLPLMSENTTFKGCDYRMLTTANGSLKTYAIELPANGSSPALPMPTNVCGLLSRESNVMGPRGRGRVYLPFPSAVAVTPQGLPSGIYQSNIQALGDYAMVNQTIAVPGFGDIGVQPVLPSSNTTINPSNWGDVVDFKARSVWGEQKKRGSEGRLNPVWP